MVARGLPFCLQTSLTRLLYLFAYFLRVHLPSISSLLAWQAPEVKTAAVDAASTTTDPAQEQPVKPTGVHSILVQFCTS